MKQTRQSRVEATSHSRSQTQVTRQTPAEGWWSACFRPVETVNCSCICVLLNHEKKSPVQKEHPRLNQRSRLRCDAHVYAVTSTSTARPRPRSLLRPRQHSRLRLHLRTRLDASLSVAPSSPALLVLTRMDHRMTQTKSLRKAARNYDTSCRRKQIS